MIIGIDIDDTIMDTFDYLMPCIAEFYGADIKELKEKSISYSNLPKEWKEREIEFCRAYYDKVVPDTPIKPNAAEYIKRIKNLGHKIYIITARDNRLYTDARKTTTEQLKKNGIEYDKLICTFDKAQACLDEGIGLFIDDGVHNCESVQKVGVPVLLFNSKGNCNENTDIKRVYDWEEIYKIVIN